jgi:hypothetical protein
MLSGPAAQCSPAGRQARPEARRAISPIWVGKTGDDMDILPQNPGNGGVN